MQPEIQCPVAAENAPGSSLEHGRVNSLLQVVQHYGATELPNHLEFSGILLLKRCIVLSKLQKSIFLYQ